MVKQNNKIGITLSGGGFRGIAHLGILKYLSESGITPSVLSGASAGALIGAFIAEGYTPDEILEISKKEKFFSYSEMIISRKGLFSTMVFEKLTKKYIPHDSFEKLKIPLFVSVTDITNAKSLIFNKGNLSLALKASACVPLVFEPVEYNDNILLCDGGLLNNFPVEEPRALCDKLIGINVDPVVKFEDPPTMRNMISRIIRIATSNRAIHSKELCDLYMEPADLNHYNTFDLKKIDDIFQTGYKYAKKFKKEIAQLKEPSSGSNKEKTIQP